MYKYTYCTFRSPQGFLHVFVGTYSIIIYSETYSSVCELFVFVRGTHHLLAPHENLVIYDEFVMTFFLVGSTILPRLRRQ